MGGSRRPASGRNGKGREPRFMETTAKLPISSLNQQTEVIVLRDLPKKKQKDKTEENAVDAGETIISSSALTAKDIESFSDRRSSKILQNEVNASIEELRIGRYGEVVTRKQYEAKLDQLSRAYNVNQLRKYLSLQLRSIRRTENAQSTETSTNIVSHDRIEISPWIPEAATPESGKEKASKDIPARLSKQEYAKRRVAQDILAQCWGLQIENELTRVGELKIRLSPDQINLWLNSTSVSVKRVLPSSPFYKNSYLELHPADGIIRIKGPRAEAVSMADTIREAFAMSSHKTIELENMQALLKPQSSITDFDTVFSPSQLREVMNLTNTNIEYDSENRKVCLSSFTTHGLRDAYRILVSLLPLPSRSTITSVSEQDFENCYVMPNTSTQGIPYRSQLVRLGRVVKAVPRKVLADDKASKGASDKPESQSLPIIQDSVKKEVLDHLSFQPDVVGEQKRAAYWNNTVDKSPWKARLGYSLRPTSSANPVKLGSGIVPTKNQNITFLPSFPSHLGLLSHLARLPGRPPAMDAMDTISSTSTSFLRPRVQLVAKLAPSPFTELGLLAPIAFPSIELVFEEEDEVPIDPFQNHLQATSNRKAVLKFKNMRAVLSHEILNVPLPSAPLDLQFSHQTVLRSKYATESDAGLRQFVDKVLKSANETAPNAPLRAPSDLKLKLPAWTLKLPREENSLVHKENMAALTARIRGSKDVVGARYLFTGFEYKERRNFELRSQSQGSEGECLLSVDHVEGGLTGGKRFEVEITPKRRDPIGKSVQKSGAEGVKAIGRGTVTTVLPMPAIFHPPKSLAISEPESERTSLFTTALAVIETISKLQSKAMTPKTSKPLSNRERERRRRALAKEKYNGVSMAQDMHITKEDDDRDPFRNAFDGQNETAMKNVSDDAVFEALDMMGEGFSEEAFEEQEEIDDVEGEAERSNR